MLLYFSGHYHQNNSHVAEPHTQLRFLPQCHPKPDASHIQLMLPQPQQTEKVKKEKKAPSIAKNPFHHWAQRIDHHKKVNHNSSYSPLHHTFPLSFLHFNETNQSPQASTPIPQALLYSSPLHEKEDGIFAEPIIKHFQDYTTISRPYTPHQAFTALARFMPIRDHSDGYFICRQNLTTPLTQQGSTFFSRFSYTLMANPEIQAKIHQFCKSLSITSQDVMLLHTPISQHSVQRTFVFEKILAEMWHIHELIGIYYTKKDIDPIERKQRLSEIWKIIYEIRKNALYAQETLHNRKDIVAKFQNTVIKNILQLLDNINQEVMAHLKTVLLPFFIGSWINYANTLHHQPAQFFRYELSIYAEISNILECSESFLEQELFHEYHEPHLNFAQLRSILQTTTDDTQLIKFIVKESFHYAQQCLQNAQLHTTAPYGTTATFFLTADIFTRIFSGWGTFPLHLDHAKHFDFAESLTPPCPTSHHPQENVARLSLCSWIKLIQSFLPDDFTLKQDSLSKKMTTTLRKIYHWIMGAIPDSTSWAAIHHLILTTEVLPFVFYLGKSFEEEESIKNKIIALQNNMKKYSYSHHSYIRLQIRILETLLCQRIYPLIWMILVNLIEASKKSKKLLEQFPHDKSIVTLLPPDQQTHYKKVTMIEPLIFEELRQLTILLKSLEDDPATEHFLCNFRKKGEIFLDTMQKKIRLTHEKERINVR